MRHERVPVTLKEGDIAWAADRDGGLRGGDHGLYAHDARWLRRFAWRWPDAWTELRLDARGPSVVRQRLSLVDTVDALGQRSPRESLAVRRTCSVRADGIDERVRLDAWPDAPVDVDARLDIEVFVEDVFEVRGFATVGRRIRDVVEHDAGRLTVRTHAPDGAVDEVTIEAHASAGLAFDLSEHGLSLRGTVPAGERREVRVSVTVRRDPSAQTAVARLRDVGGGRASAAPPTSSPDAWRERIVPHERRGRLGRGDDALALAAADDLRALLLPTAFGPVPAAGVPWYVAPFGRDALLTCLMVPEADDARRATLRLLALLQGRRHDSRSAEAPGKIPHEMRVGAATRNGRAPFGPHYGTVDATPLWIVTLARAVEAGDDALLRELAPQLRAALAWMRSASDGPGGLLRFTSGDGGYEVQSWKDAGDSMTHRDGRLARGRLAVVEVQGYAEAAWRAAAGLLRRLGDDAAGDHEASDHEASDYEASDEATRRADALRRVLSERFFRPDLGAAGVHALALDEDDAPLEVVASDAGHLLFTGSVTLAEARSVARSLLAPDAWSGWGVRTLAQGERRYAAVSYHCGSVWPHDTALFALGLERYGLRDEARAVARAVLDLAGARPDRRAPELIAGDDRDDGPPADYPDACRLQAWSAAAVVAMHALLSRSAASSTGD